jgi:hypothetical protein
LKQKETEMIKRFVTSKAVVFAGLLSLPVASPQDNSSTQASATPVTTNVPVSTKPGDDPRAGILRAFFVKYRSPAGRYVEEFLSAADQNALDWRLLPSISIIESGGGKAGVNNNIFGWDSCRQAFLSIPHGIRAVAEQLSKSMLYRNKDTDGILRTYNPYPDYGHRVKAVMRSLGPARVPVMAEAALN